MGLDSSGSYVVLKKWIPIMLPLMFTMFINDKTGKLINVFSFLVHNQPSTMPEMSTPQKGASRKLFGTPGGSPSFSTPSTKGRSEDVSGFLVGVGFPEKSRKGNTYYLLQVQVSKSELISLMVMEDQNNPKRGEFLAFSKKPVTFYSVFPGNETYFFSRSKGSGFKPCAIDHFTIDDLTVSLQHISTKQTGTYHIKVMLKWVGDPETTKNGSKMRKAIVADITGSFKLTIWKGAWWPLLKEDTVYIMTNIILDEFFGYYLKTSVGSTYEKCDEKIEAACPDDIDDIIRRNKEVTIQCEGIDSVALTAIAYCSTCDNSIPIIAGDKFFDCGPCDETRWASKCRYEMTGSIVVMAPLGEAPTLTPLKLVIDATTVDMMFGEGTAQRYGNKLKELKRHLKHLKLHLSLLHMWRNQTVKERKTMNK